MPDETAKMQFECVVSADLFRRAMLAVSTEETRYYLNGVHVSPAPEGGAILCATNGYMLIATHDPDAYIQGEGIVMLSKPMKAALKVSGIMLETRLLIARTEKSGGRAFVVDMPTRGADDDYSAQLAARELFDAPDKRVKAAQFGPICIDGKFPDWRRIIPKGLAPAGAIPPVSQALLARAADALCIGAKNRQVRLTANEDSAGPVFMTAAHTPGIAGFALIMPLHDDSKPAAVPEWVRIPQAEAA